MYVIRQPICDSAPHHSVIEYLTSLIVKQRLDIALVEKGLAESRQRARALIMAGRVLVNRHPVEKPGAQIRQTDHVRIRGEEPEYASRGGLKLEDALETFAIDVTDCTCLDVGASTGGFTDCLLQRGASQVFAVDVGYGQLAWRLRQDPRVVVIERTNIRYMPFDKIGCRVDVITVDVSFISLKIVVPAVLKFIHPQGRIVALIKPQFEVGRENVGKGGVVRDPTLHAAVLGDLEVYFQTIGLRSVNTAESPVMGPKGNREFFTLLTPFSQR